MSEINAGTVIDDRYRVISRIGSGGMADVYLADDQLLSRQVAVKVLHHRFVDDQEFVERFRREASSAAGISHRNVVAIFDRGEWNETYYIAMEYLPGRSLKTIVRDRGALDVDTAIAITIQILNAARYAHSQGVVHRDIKPHNVILSDEGRVTVTDFGIARAGGSDITHTGSIMGTAQYLSPEQAQGHPVTAASDIYAIGILLYELLTGRVPFEGDSAVAIALQHLSAEPLPPSSLNASVPPELDQIVLRALAKDPSDRYPDAPQFVAALEAARGAWSGPPTAEHSVAVLTPALEGIGAPTTVAATASATTPANAAAAYSSHRDGAAAAGASGHGLVVGLPSPPDEGSGAGTGRRRLWWWAAGAVLIGAIALALALALAPSQSRIAEPPLVGVTEATAVHTLKALGLKAAVTQSASVTALAGTVISQRPPAETLAASGAVVYLLVSSGPAVVAVPNVTGLSEARALQAVRARQLEPQVQPQANRHVRSGDVISTNPSAGLEAVQGTPVTVYVSTGRAGKSSGKPALVHVPNVTGLPQSAAAAALSSVGLAVGTVNKRQTSAQPPGTVVSQIPVGGAQLTPGGAVLLVVAEAPTELEVPDVVGSTRANAEATLRAKGFAPASKTRIVTNPAENGTVLEETPEIGQTVKRGQTVTILVGALSEQAATTTTAATEVP